MKLSGKRIVITGGTSGIGLELADQLAEHNDVIVVSRSPELSRPVSGKITLIQADLARQSQLESATDRIIRSYDSLDILINNAAIQNTPDLLHDDFEFDGIHHEVTVNFTAVCQLTAMLLPLLQRAPQAAIVNVNSGLALAPKRSSAIYCATKAALDSFSRSLAYQLEGTNISVQQAFLPLVDTAMTRGRGNGKLSAENTAGKIIEGIETDRTVNDIGKVKLLRLIMRLAPSLGRKIMRNN